MKKCPVCDIPLTTVDYTGFNVMQCAQCHGHLVDVSRLNAIERTARKTQDELKAEVRAEYQGDQVTPVKCPTCRMTMRKQPLELPSLTLQLDACQTCALLWLDGGELALAQLQFRTTPVYTDAQELKRRTAELEADPERKAIFEEHLARLPDEKNPLVEAAQEMFETKTTGLDLVLDACLLAFTDK